MSGTSIGEYIWYEKYRPKTMQELVLPEGTRAAFDKFITDGTIPHLLFHGLPGSGKTTAAQIITSLIPCTVLSLNASSGDRGVETMKTKVKQFAGSAPMAGRELKVVFMDEADGLTADAQRALKNTIETYQKYCRFLFTANEVDRIDGAIRSRCMTFQFDQFPLDNACRLACRVLRQENITFDRNVVQQVVERFYPDFRTIFNVLHLGSLSGSFNPASVAALNIDMTTMFTLVLEGKVTELRQYVAGITDFSFIYKSMFDDLIPYIADSVEGPFAEQGHLYAMQCVMTLAEHLAMDSTIPDRELCFISCCVGIMRACNVEAIF